MKQAHTLREYQYYDKDTLCSIIDADFTTKQVRVENKVDSILDTAFGVNTEPTWDDFLEPVPPMTPMVCPFFTVKLMSVSDSSPAPL